MRIRARSNHRSEVDDSAGGMDTRRRFSGADCPSNARIRPPTSIPKDNRKALISRERGERAIGPHGQSTILGRLI
jgi:hypothetical protein